MGRTGKKVFAASSKKGNKEKERSAKKGNKETDKNAKKGNKETEKKQQFRCTMAGLQGEFAKHRSAIKATHLESMKNTPFYTLFYCLHMRYIDSSDCRRNDRVSEDIIRAFDPTQMKFIVGGKAVGITKNDVRLIFGIVDGRQKVAEPTMGKKNAWRFCNRIFVGKNELTPKLIKEKLSVLFGRAGEDERPDDVDDIVRLLCLLAISSFFLLRVGARMSWGCVEYVENLKEMRSFDWSGRILELLVESLESHHKTPYQVKGCTLLPLYWLCEHANVMKVREDMGGDSGMIPRVVKWHLLKMKDIIIQNIVGDEVVFGICRASSAFCYAELPCSASKFQGPNPEAKFNGKKDKGKDQKAEQT